MRQAQERQGKKECESGLRRVLPVSHLKVGEHQYLDHTLEVPSKPLKTAPIVVTNTITPPCVLPPLCLRGVPTAMATVTALPSVLALSCKHSTIHHISRQLLSQYLLSLKKAHSPLTNIQSVQSSLYPEGLGNLGSN
jgi:hypothetical protein